MKRLAASALVAFSLAACAQRGAGHVGGGGFSAHATSGFHSSFSAGPSRGFASGVASGPRPVGGGVRAGYGRPVPAYRGYGPRTSTARPAFYSNNSNIYRRRWPDRGYPGYGFDAGYPGGSGVWLTPYELGYPSTIGDGYAESAGSAAAVPYADAGPPGASGYPEPQSYADPQAYAGQFTPPAAQSVAAAPAALEPEDAVTLIYKDGRSEQIHNYALTRTTLYVTDKHHRDIPLDQLDLAATERVNHDAGVSFALPTAQ